MNRYGIYTIRFDLGVANTDPVSISMGLDGLSTGIIATGTTWMRIKPIP